MKYDDASWHSEGEFPETSPDEYGGTHIALLLKWCLLKGWAGEETLEDCHEELAKLLRGELTGTEYLFQCCDGKLIDVMLNDHANEFLSWYYGDQGPYMNDYCAEFHDSVYVAGEESHDWEKFSAMVQRRYDEWRAA